MSSIVTYLQFGLVHLGLSTMHLFYVALLTVLAIDYNVYLIPMLYVCLIAYIMYMFDCFICMFV